MTTAPLTAEALVEALAETLWGQIYGRLEGACWESAQRRAKMIPDGRAAHNIDAVRQKASEIVAKHFAPALATATAEAARLRGEVEAKDRALKEAAEVHDRYGNDVERVLRDHLGASCSLNGASQTEVAQHTARSILFAIAEANRIAAFERMDRTALARAATEEGQADG